MKPRTYLDWNATAPMRIEARDAMIAAMDIVGNPSSVHAEGRVAKGMIEKAREHVADLMGCERADVVFAASATEAAAMTIPDLSGVLMSGVEHDAIYAWGEIDNQRSDHSLDINSDGLLTGTINGASISDAIWGDLIALQAANSETGVLQKTLPLAQEIWATKRKALIVVDAVQAWGKIPYTVDRSGGDYILLSGHKFGGPKGIGAVYVKPGVDTRRVVKGGGQEEGRRSGTENVIGIVGIGAAAQAAKAELESGVWDQVKDIRDAMETRIAEIAPNAILFGKNADRLPNTSSFAVPGWKGATQVMQMDIAGFAISAGSACSSGKVKTSRVLKTMGFDDITAASAVRISLGPTTTTTEVDKFVDAWATAYEKFAARAA